MEGKERRVWPYQIESSLSLVSSNHEKSTDVNPNREKRIELDACAICRGLLSKPCIECQANFAEFIADHEQDAQQFRKETRTTWSYVLLLAKRPPFNMFPMDVIGLICKHSFPSKSFMQSNVCPVTQLYCDHTFHVHCFKRWLARRESCPLYNAFFPSDGALELMVCNQNFQVVSDASYVSSAAFVSKKDWKDRVYVARARIENLLKVNRTWTSVDHIYAHYTLKLSPDIGAVPQHRFLEVLSGLVKDGYIECDDQNYKYIP